MKIFGQTKCGKHTEARLTLAISYRHLKAGKEEFNLIL